MIRHQPIAFAAATILFVSGAATLATAAPPPISDPFGRLVPGFDAPGAFPSTVNATNIDFSPLAGVEIGGAGQDFLSVEFPSGGPLPWTASRYNAGDLHLSIGPADPLDPLSFPPAGFVNRFEPLDDGSAVDPLTHDLTTLAWHMNQQSGALFASTRVNGVDSGYAIPQTGGQQVGTYYGVTYFGSGFGQSWGFNPVTGEFTPAGGNGQVFGLAGLVVLPGPVFPPINEVAFDAAAAYFPYEQGWTGAWVNSGVDGPATFAASSPDITPASVTWTGGLADVSLPGVDSATDGMLFVAPSEFITSDTKIASAFPNASGGWTTHVRFDYLVADGVNFDPPAVLQTENEFQFLYIPYDAQGLVGGHVDSQTGGVTNGAGQSQFSLARTATGQYALSVFEEDGVTKRTEDDGMILLSVADTFATDPTIGSQAILSYEYDAASGEFLIESRILVNPLSGTPNGAFLNEFALFDADFYFAWVDFQDPLSPPASLLGDADGDGDVDGDDLIAVQTEFGAIGPAPLLGDADDDGDVDGDDLIAVQTEFGAILAATVPEPTGAALLLAGLGAAIARRR